MCDRCIRGDATANGFTVSASGTTVLAFSFTGSVVPAGEGTLVELSGDVSEDCLSELIFSDIDGNALDAEFGSGSTDDGGDDGGDCTQDCEGINDVDNEDVDSVCDWFSSLEVLQMNVLVIARGIPNND